MKSQENSSAGLEFVDFESSIGGLMWGVRLLAGSKYKKLLLYCFCCFELAACVYGPKTKHMSTLDYLNGKHYDVGVGRNSSPQFLGSSYSDAAQLKTETNATRPEGSLFWIKRRRANSIISGHLYYLDQAIPTPLVHQRLQLYSSEQKVAETMTDGGGSFSFSADIPNGELTIHLESERFILEHMLSLNGFEVENLTIVAHRKKM